MIKTPASIEKDMKFFRMGLAPLPQKYIDFHLAVAALDITSLIKEGYMVAKSEIERCFMACDGMKYLTVTVADPEGKTFTIKWHESGAWFKEGAGWTRWREAQPESIATIQKEYA